MRWLKFTAAGTTSWGLVEGDKVISVSGDPFGEWQRGTQTHALKDVKIELPRPRDLRLKRDARFIDYERMIWETIREEVIRSESRGQAIA